MNRPLIQTVNALDDATASLLDGAVITEFPLTSLLDGDQAEAAQFSTPAAMILYTFPAPVHIAVVGLLHHNLPAALGVQWRGYDSLPTDETTTADTEVDPKVPLEAVEPDGLRPNAWFDVDAVDAGASHRYWALVVPTGSDLDLIIGELFASYTQDELPNGIGVGYTFGPDVETIRNRTYGGVIMKARKATRVEAFDLSAQGTRVEMLEIRAWFIRLAGTASNALFVPGVPTRAIGDAYFVEFDRDSFRIRNVGGDTWSASFTLRELTRGLHWDLVPAS